MHLQLGRQVLHSFAVYAEKTSTGYRANHFNLLTGAEARQSLAMQKNQLSQDN